MAVLTTDTKFKRRVKKSLKVDREDLWRELNQIASFLALIGAVSEALDVWAFMYSGLVPLPDPDDRTISVFGDGAVSAICHQMQCPDISKGLPAPSFAGRDQRRIVAGNLTERITELDAISRQRITMDAWYGCNWVENPPPELAATAILRTARIQSRSSSSSQPPRTDEHAVAALIDLIDHNPAFRDLHPCFQAEGLLLVADHAARNKNDSDAVRFLRMWHDVSVDWDYNIEEVFGLIPIARSICNGALSEKHSLSPETRREIVKELIHALTTRLQKPEVKKRPKWKYSLCVSYGQFYLEPLKGDPQAVYFQADEESEQGFSSFPQQVAFSTPDSDHDCLVEVEFAKKRPSIQGAVQAVVVPLLVESSDGLYLRTVDDSGKKSRLNVPRGKYDVMARLFPLVPKNKSEDSGAWRAILTFLPGGTLKPKCMKHAFGKPTSSVFLHE